MRVAAEVVAAEAAELLAPWEISAAKETIAAEGVVKG